MYGMVRFSDSSQHTQPGNLLPKGTLGICSLEKLTQGSPGLRKKTDALDGGSDDKDEINSFSDNLCVSVGTPSLLPPSCSRKSTAKHIYAKVRNQKKVHNY